MPKHYISVVLKYDVPKVHVEGWPPDKAALENLPLKWPPPGLCAHPLAMPCMPANARQLCQHRLHVT